MSSDYEARVASFVEGLAGRYSDHCSDKFLVSLLCYRLHTSTPYDAAVLVFESILEGDCGAGGNGHHVAQGFAKAMEGDGGD